MNQFLSLSMLFLGVVLALFTEGCRAFAPRPSIATLLNTNAKTTTSLFLADMPLEEGEEELFFLQHNKEDDDLDDLDDQWMAFQEQRQQVPKQVRLADLALETTTTTETQQATNDNNNGAMQEVAMAGAFFLVAITCLVGVYYSGTAPVLVATTNHMDIIPY
ncbi:expressed unknown protein [Seminavis robusta]|uniref:Transmembrane protein n=1 Tax=Seminavis robusta TaxID=568900 RepID=A0A9N8H6I9_9STRA|nr:expressed unknown protein [Seminavis robusta]|eukprot:Sro113_g056060.1 n/a (162) ;mRNA; r:58733-59218